LIDLFAVDEIALGRLEEELLHLGLGARDEETKYLGYYIVSSLTIITLHASIKSKVIDGASCLLLEFTSDRHTFELKR
jgi:hypothetical protein